MPTSNRGDGASRDARGSRGAGAGERSVGTGRAGGRDPGGVRSTGYARGRARSASGVGGSTAGYRAGTGSRASGAGYRAGTGYRPTGQAGSGTGGSYRGTGGSYRGSGGSSRSQARRDLGSGGTQYRGSGRGDLAGAGRGDLRGAGRGDLRGAAPATSRGVGGSRRSQPPRSSSQREGGHGSPNGGWNRPGPRRDRPAVSRRDEPEGRPEADAEDVAERDRVPSSIGRAATMGHNLWPRAPRAPRSAPPDALREELNRASRGAPRSSGSPRPAPGRRSPAVGGNQRSVPARRTSGGPGRPLSQTGRTPAARGSATARRELGGDQVEGRQAVRELLAARRRTVQEVWMMEGSDPAAILREIQSLARANHVPVRLVTQRQIQQVQGSEAPQGVIAFAAALTEADLSDLVASGPTEASTTTFLLVVDGVTDPQNLGALLRSAECAGVTGVVLPRHRSAHVTPTVTKVAAGAVEHVRIAVVPGVPGALQELQRLGVFTVGLDERGAEPLFGLGLGDRPLALVIGAEGRGLAPLSRQRCDVLARIPLQGSIDSLNVSAAGAVAMFEVARQRSTQPG